VLCYYTVFNVEQGYGITLPQIDQPATSTEIDIDEGCEAILTGWADRPALHLTGEHEYRAYYRPSSDSVAHPRADAHNQRDPDFVHGPDIARRRVSQEGELPAFTRRKRCGAIHGKLTFAFLNLRVSVGFFFFGIAFPFGDSCISAAAPLRSPHSAR
jgi:hypothetical protein